MASITDRYGEEKNDGHSEDNEPNKHFESLHIGEGAMSKETIADNASKSKGSDSKQFSPMDSEEDHSSRSSTYKKRDRKFDTESSLEGNWTLLCSTEVDSCATNLSNDDVLPSQVTDQLYIYLENDEVKIDEHMQEGGKWMVFTQGDPKKLDQYWTCLKTLFCKGTFVGLKASTALNPDSGVINCYTADAGDWVEVKKAAVAIRDVIDYPFIMYYKTNEASAQGQYREKGCRLISRYMFTIKGSFYEKDKYGRWEWI